MNDESIPELSDDVLALLSDESVWTDFDADLAAATVAAVMAEASSAELDTGTEPSPVVNLADRRRVRWSSALLGAAAALLIVACGFVVTSVVQDTDEDDIVLALAATDVEPGASGSAGVRTTPDGTRIVLETTGLPPAPEGFYYEAWLRTGPDVGVSAGTFHLRGGGDRSIELWAGVSIEDYPLLTVTLQPEAMAESSGVVVLAARLGG
ncbi:MAG: anti-sigma factor [Ilumatobacter sp.]